MKQEAGDTRIALEAAYRRTLYCVPLAAGELVLHIGEHRPEHDQRLRTEAGIRSHWAIVTPCNPGSVPLEPAQNSVRLVQLVGELRRIGLRSFPSMNRDPLQQWPDETGFLLCDPPPGTAEGLGREFGQNAIVAARLGAAPELAWLQP